MSKDRIFDYIKDINLFAVWYNVSIVYFVCFYLLEINIKIFMDERYDMRFVSK